MTRERMIGLDRPVRLEWLDAAAGRLAAGASERDTKDYLWKLLDGTVAGETPQSARGKTMTVLSRIWITVPEQNRVLRQRALELIESASPAERIAAHWAMTSAAYPIFLDVATIAGKLLRLHGSVALAQVVRRITATWGDRSTLRTAVQRIMRMMVGWGVLSEGVSRGEFHGPAALTIGAPFAALVFQVVLLDAGGSMGLSELMSHPSVFPFAISVNSAELRAMGHFQLHREGSEVDVVSL